MARVVISYARKDASALADRLARDLAPQHTPWLDRGRILGGQEWAEAIEEAIDNADALLALLSGASFDSRICRAEHMRALRRGKRVIPLLVTEGADRPLYLEGTHFLDFSQPGRYAVALDQLFDALGRRGSSPVQESYRATYVNAPALPAHYVERTESVESLRREVLRDNSDGESAMVAVHGMPGAGKSSLALGLCHDQLVQDAFPDGVIWIDVGSERRGDALTPALAQVGAAFGDDAQHYNALAAATTRVRKLLERRAVLLVLDDVWFTDQVAAFSVASPACRILFTTRDESAALQQGAVRLRLGAMSAEQSLKLLAGWSGSHAPEFTEIANRVGHHPLALKLAGIRLATAFSPRQWLESFDRVSRLRAGRRAAGPDDSVRGCLDLSVEALAPEDRVALDALGLFPAAAPLPASAYCRLWRVHRGWSEFDGREFAQDLLRLGLVEPAEADAVRLHDLVHGYLLENLGEQLRDMHRRFLKSYLDTAETWDAVPADGYVHEHIAHHLLGGQQVDTLRSLCLDIGWLSVKLRIVGVPGIVADLAQLPGDAPLRALHAALRLAASAVTRRPAELHTQLLARVEPGSEIESLLLGSQHPGNGCWLKPISCDLRRAGGAVLCALDSRSSKVTNIALAPDGSRVAVAHRAASTQIWDVASGSLEREIPADGGTDWRVAISADGRWLLTASEAGDLRIRDIGTGAMLRALQAGDAVLALALSADGRYLAAGTRSGAVRLWDLEHDRGRDLASGEGTGIRGVSALAFSEDSAFLLASTSGTALRAWSTAPPEAARTLCAYHMFVGGIPFAVHGGRVIFAYTPWQAEHGWVEVVDLASGTVLQRFASTELTTAAVAMSPDGRLGAAAGTSVRLYDLDGGTELQALPSPEGAVRHLRWPIDELLLVASGRQTVTAWDPVAATVRGVFTHPSGALAHLDVAAGGARAASATWTGDVRIWRTLSGANAARASHAAPVCCVAIDGTAQRAVSGDAAGGLLLWDLAAGGQSKRMQGHGDGIDSVCFSPDGARLLSASRDGTVRVLSAADGLCTLQLAWPATRGGEARWCADGEHIAAVAADGSVHIWRLPEGQRVFHCERASQCAWSFGPGLQPGYLFVAWHDGRLRRFDLPTGAVMAAADTSANCYFTAAAAGRQLAVVKCEDGPDEWFGRLRVWDATTLSDHPSPAATLTAIGQLQMLGDGSCLCAGTDGVLQRRDLAAAAIDFESRQHDGAINRVVATPDESRAVSVGADACLCLWDLATGAVLASYTADEPLVAVAAAAQGRVLIAGDRAGGIHLLNMQDDEATRGSGQA